MRALLVLLVPACMFIDPVSHCDDLGYSAAILEPANGATVPLDVVVHARWSPGYIEGLYTKMVDDQGTWIRSSAPDERLGDGSVLLHYRLPAGGMFDFEIGWFCTEFDADTDLPLATSQFHTAP